MNFINSTVYIFRNMGKGNKPVKKASKTAVKVGNKKQNKVNKSKKNRSASKAKVSSNKVNARC